MNKRMTYIVESTLKQLIAEAPAQETDNSEVTSTSKVFTPAEKKFLGKFDARGVNHLGIIYNISDVGIQEFITRSGKDLNLTPGILLSLLRSGVIKLVPYGGWGRNDNYTIELQLSLNAVSGLGAEEKKEIEAGTSGGGGAAPAPEEPAPAAPGPENAWVVRYGDILSESSEIIKQIFNTSKSETISEKITKTSNILNISKKFHELPLNYIHFLEHAVAKLNKKLNKSYKSDKIIAEVVNNLHTTMQISLSDIKKSYDLRKSAQRLQKFLDK
jgi:hypothetical protein